MASAYTFYALDMPTGVEDFTPATHLGCVSRWMILSMDGSDSPTLDLMFMEFE